MVSMRGARGAIGIILACFAPSSEAFFTATLGGGDLALLRQRGGVVLHSTPISPGRQVSLLRESCFSRPQSAARRSTAVSGTDPDSDDLLGDFVEDDSSSTPAEDKDAWKEDMNEDEDAPALSKEFYNEIAARWNTTVKGAIKQEENIQFDKGIYNELRERRDFGLEQDLELELEKRNISKETNVLQIVDQGLPAAISKFPNPELTPREVVLAVLEALKSNDEPYHNHGVEVFVRFQSPSSAMFGVGLEGVARYLAENRSRACMHWEAISYSRPLTVSGGLKKNKAFQPLKLKDTMTGTWHPVSVYLTLDGKTDCWLIESLIVKGDI